MASPSVPKPYFEAAQALLPYTLTAPHYEPVTCYGGARLRRSETKHSSHDDNKRKKKHTKNRRHRSKKHKFAAYILQCIGVLCLVLAALKSFEPLAGIGFALVMMGYKGKEKGEAEIRRMKKQSSKDGLKDERRAKKKMSVDTKGFLDVDEEMVDDEDWELVEDISMEIETYEM